jgi:AcrR family transcriptional regulator
MKKPRVRAFGPAGKPAYHHGDLRAVLLRAAEVELAENGIQGFTLRGCARRAGVSHAAPAHHFADVTALLTEMAAIGFERLTATMQERRAQAPADPRAQFIASGGGYIAFALANPQHFALMFGRAGLDKTNQRLTAAGKAAFQELLEVIAGITGEREPLVRRRGRLNVTLAWSFVHGFSHLNIGGRLGSLTPPGPEEQGDVAALLGLIASAVGAALDRATVPEVKESSSPIKRGRARPRAR